MKNLASKCYITISSIPKKRYSYYLTPSGFAEKTRLTLRHIQNFTSLYKVARRDFQLLFSRLGRLGLKRVVFCGLGEVASGGVEQRCGRIFIYKADLKNLSLLPDGFVDGVVSVSALEHNDHEEFKRCMEDS